MHTCSTCRFWQPYTTDTNLGICSALGLLLWPKGDDLDIIDGKLQADVAISPGADSYGGPVSDVLDVRTTARFGCIVHQPR